MKRFLTVLSFALALMVGCTTSYAQSSNPRYGITPNSDNTGRVLTYGYSNVTDVAGPDSALINLRYYDLKVKLALVDSFTFKNPVLTSGFYGDNLSITVTGASGTKVKFAGSNWITNGTLTMSTGATARIAFIILGTKLVETGRIIY